MRRALRSIIRLSPTCSPGLVSRTKKSLVASERRSAKVRHQRADWFTHRLPAIGQQPERVVFIDETSVKTNLTRIRGRSLRGQRLTMDAPFGSWGTQTLIAGLAHDRLIAPFYPIAFTTIAFAWLGAPSTTRQNRTMSMVSMALAVFVLRLTGFASGVAAITAPIAIAGQYIVLAVMMLMSLRAISHGTAIEQPAWLTNLITKISERVTRRFATS